MKTLIGNENTRVIHFGKRHRVAVTFRRAGGLWHAHAALLPKPQRSILVARQIVARKLQDEAARDSREPLYGRYVYEWITRDESGRLHLHMQACALNDDGQIIGSDWISVIDRHSQDAVAAMAASWGLRRRHGDPAETAVEDGHTLIAHRMTRTK